MKPSGKQSHSSGCIKVLFLASWYPDRANPGRGVFVREHARAVCLHDEVTILHLQGADRQLKKAWKIVQEHDEELAQGIPTFRVRHRPSPFPNTSFLVYLFSALQAFRYITHTGFRPDILHAHIHRAGLPAVLLGQLFKIPVVITEHNSAFPRKMLRKSDMLIARFAFSRAAFVLPVSLALQRGIQDLGIRANFQVVPNAVDTALFSPASTNSSNDPVKKLLFAGGLIPVKGLPILFQSLFALKEQRGDWRLDILGDGPERIAYQRMVEQFGMASRIFFHGSMPKTEVAGFMRSADLFILPSLWENLPCVLLEAMASGLPVLSTRIGGIPEIISPETGVLVPPGDAQALRVELAQMLDKLHQFDHRQIAGKAQRYSLQAVGGQIHSIYRELLDL